MDAALILSIISIALSCLALGWNIYKDIVLKPRVKVTFKKMHIVGGGVKDNPPFLNISVTNLGPGLIKISSITSKQSSLWRRLSRTVKWAFIMHDYTNQYSAKLPLTIDVGDRADILLPFEADSFLAHGLTHIGVHDYYGRTHWAPSKHVMAAKEIWSKEFPDAEMLE